jgi:cell division protein ZapA
MGQVTVRINGYAYTLGCEDGQEGHLQAMASQVEQRIDGIKAMGGQNGEARLLVLASLLMADELHDLKANLSSAKSGKEELHEVAHNLQLLAGRAEAIAATVEDP